MEPSSSGPTTQLVQDSSSSIMPAPGTSSVWPGAFGIFAKSRDAVLRNFFNYLVVCVLVIAVSILSDIVARAHNYILAFIAGIVSNLCEFVLLGTLAALNLAAARGSAFQLDQLFPVGLRTFWKLFVINFVLVAMALVSLLLLVLPFFFVLFYVLPRLSLASYFAVDEAKPMGPFAAMAASWEVTKGNLGKVWGIIGVSVLIILPAITIIGILATIALAFLYLAAWAFLYIHLTHTQVTPPAAAASTAAGTMLASSPTA